MRRWFRHLLTLLLVAVGCSVGLWIVGLLVRPDLSAHASAYSGQEIQIAGQKMTVLSDAQGGIILMGNDFAWSSREPAFAKSSLKIEAKRLGVIAM